MIYVCNLSCNSNSKLPTYRNEFLNALPPPSIIVLSEKSTAFLESIRSVKDYKYSYRIILFDSTASITALDFYNKKFYAVELDSIQNIRQFELTNNLILPKKNYYNFFIRDNNIYFANFKEKVIYKLKKENDNFLITDSITFYNLDTKGYYITNSNIDLVGKYSNTKIVLNYVLNDRSKFNFIDNTNFIVYNESSNEIEHLGFYPKSYKVNKIKDYFSLFDMLNDSVCAFTYAMNDEIYLLNINTKKILSKSKIHDKPYYPIFDKRRVGDLGYSRNFMNSSETNIFLKVINGHVVVIKALPSKSILEGRWRKYFVFDNNLKLKYADTIRYKTNNIFFEPYKKGFMLMSQPINKLYYYEIP